MRIASRWVQICLAAAAGGMLCLAIAVQAGPPEDEDPEPDKSRVSLDTARDRARLLHDVYSTTLDVMHERFFERGRSTLPARALEDVFEILEQESRGKAQWISVNTKAMTIDHEPKTEYEKAAARELAAGKQEWELVENGVYRRATPIPLSSSCVGCHTGFFVGAPKSPRMAGLIISIPLKDAPAAAR